MKRSLSTYFYYSAIVIIGILFISCLITSLSWFFGISLVKYSFFISTFTTLSLLFIVLKRSLKDVVFTFLLTALLFIISYFLAELFYDYSYDGQCYHQRSIYAIMNGWNPVSTPAPQTNEITYLWVNHYPKGMETLSAILGSLFNDVEMGKSINFLLNFVLLGFIARFTQSFLNNSKTVIRWLINFCLLFCPVFAYQCFTFYIDYSTYIIICSVLINLYFLEQKRKESLFIIGVLFALSISFKLNCAFWITIILILYSVRLILKQDFKTLKRGFACSLFAVILGVFVFGFNPYITNIKEHHHILYPLAGKEKVDIISYVTPKVLKDKNRVEQVFISLSSRPSNRDEYQNPLKITEQNKYDLSTSDIRMGGFGMIGVEVFFVSLLLVFLADKRNKKAYLSLIFAEILLLVSLFVLPSGWWARYVPFFWLFACIPLLYNEKYKRKCTLYINYLLMVLMIANFVITVKYVVKRAEYNTKQTEYYLSEMEKSQPIKIDSRNDAFLFKLEKRKIQTIETKELPYKLNIDGPEIRTEKQF
ncbi:MAG: hypothetical protein IJ180_11805 [Bacteroidales bacterium]|nr:hypothetical protein [Bacteroidales bacterium]MBQ9255442.1 hypothetical protein [Bacteroidales bacterium]